MKIRKAVIPAAGLGTRFLPATKAIPKEMVPIVDKPTLQYIVEEAAASGIEDILIITGRTKRAIEDHFDKSYELETELEKSGKLEYLHTLQKISDLANIHYVRQKEAKGLGHAIYCAKVFAENEPFAVLLGDDVVVAEKPCLAQMMEQFESLGSTILGVRQVPDADTSKYGIVTGEKVADKLHRVDDMVEKPAPGTAPSNVAVMGRYIITPEIFRCLEETKPGAGGEIQLTDALKMLTQRETVYGYEFEGKRYDVGSKHGYLEATVECALKRPDLKDDFLAYLKQVVSRY